MLPWLMIALGAALAAGTAFAARRTRRVPSDPAPDGDAWERFSPDPDTERGRPRWWPAAGVLAGIATLCLGLVALGLPAPSDQTADVHRGQPYLIEVASASEITPEPSPSPSPTPTPEPSAVPDDASDGSSSGRARSPGGSGGGDAAPSRPAPPPPTPTPTPKPGPRTSANTSCFNGTLSFGYTLEARAGTTLSSARISLDGRTVQQPPVSGRTRYTSNYQTSAGPGEHTVLVHATASDGGVTNRGYSITC